MMQKNGQKIPQRGRTWPEKAPQGRGGISSFERSKTMSPPRGDAAAAVSSECNWYHKVSVCYLECRGRSTFCQCVIAKLSPELRRGLRFRGGSGSSSGGARGRGKRDTGAERASSVVLALIAPHSFLHHANLRELREWRMHTGVESLHRHKHGGLPLHEKYVSHSYTCCGPEGVWRGSKSHHGRAFVDENSCPFRADFTVLILRPELADQLKDVLTIPSVPSMDEATFSQALRSGNHYFSLIERDKTGLAETHKVLVKPPRNLGSGSNLATEDLVQAYKETCQLEYTCGYDRSSPGAGIVYFDSTTPDNALVLAAVHLYSRRDDEILTHCALSLPAIFHAIAGSQVCGVIPCLSLLTGACNSGHWGLRFYSNLQNCLHPENDPGDKQKRYHWTSQLMRVCDYLCWEEAQAVLRLEPTDNPQIVLASLNLFSALLGCFQRVIESDGVSQFHCQISTVFLTRASERVYEGLEGLFQRLYRHLVNQSSGDDIVMACIECWLKMCTIVGTRRSAFYEVAKFTRVKGLRDSPRFQDNSHFQRLFGDLCLTFLTHTRMAAHEAVDSSTASHAQAQRIKQKNQELLEKVDQLQEELSEAYRVINNSEAGAFYPHHPPMGEESTRSPPSSPGL